MAYLTYADYTGMGGTLTQTAFTNLEYEARKQIDKLTHERVVDESPVREAVKRLTFRVVEFLRTSNEAMTSGVKSAGNGVASVTYFTPKEVRAQIAGFAADYLAGEVTDDGTLLMYAGVDA